MVRILHIWLYKDPAPKFIDAETQKLLKSITRLQLDKIFRNRPNPINTVEYKFMTTEEIENEVKKAFTKARELLQMPPIVQVEQANCQVISKDPGLDSYSNCKYVITDITYGVNDSERTIVVRQTDGTLETADPKLRKRINQIYFPLQNRHIRDPRMFEEENLRGCLDRHEYEFVLDRMCIQFEPFEQKFHEISSKVYLHINETKEFDILRSTRHFGPMSFFLAWHKMIDDLVIDMIKRDYLTNAVEVICLMYNLNGIEYDKGILKQLEQFTSSFESREENGFAIAKKGLEKELNETVGKSIEQFKIDEASLEFIDAFCKSHAIKKIQLTLCLQMYKEGNEEKKRLLEGLRKAHGVS
ncbi:28S ribosomal protein S22, mitochondrial [Pseudolycoriella hygida]|uniref:28S ribosomal protein S22, mitochondrial n=1 Tax=Pseudolycoriella hygida TaxID=35572 RepID=A0A9Q0S3D4_9DIPT|nr:28S ribosomal protein S22, mitochondrial [Pseudolycoriella hygida]